LGPPGDINIINGGLNSLSVNVTFLDMYEYLIPPDFGNLARQDRIHKLLSVIESNYYNSRLFKPALMPTLKINKLRRDTDLFRR
jgi:hypothetical protein